jgi:hypothetical protein
MRKEGESLSRADGTLEQTIGGTTAVSADEMHCRKYDAPLILKMVLIVINLVPDTLLYFFQCSQSKKQYSG